MLFSFKDFRLIEFINRLHFLTLFKWMYSALRVIILILVEIWFQNFNINKRACCSKQENIRSRIALVFFRNRLVIYLTSHISGITKSHCLDKNRRYFSIYFFVTLTKTQEVNSVMWFCSTLMVFIQCLNKNIAVLHLRIFVRSSSGDCNCLKLGIGLMILWLW